jgi:hypothetical protein
MANRVLIGEHDSLGYGLFISKPTKDVTSATREDLLFSTADAHSSGILKVMDITVSSGTGSANFNADGSSLGYIPFILITEIRSGVVMGMVSHYSNDFQGNYSWGNDFSCNVTNSSITVFDSDGGTGTSGTFRAIVYAIPAVS